MSRPVQIVTTDDIDEESDPMVVVSANARSNYSNDDANLDVPLVNAVPASDSEASAPAQHTAQTMNYYYYQQLPPPTTIVSFNTVRTTTTTTTTTQSLVKYDRRGCCSWVGNVLWLLLGGWHMFFSWMVAGLVLCVTCIFIPCGVQCIKIACFLLCPFGKTVVHYGSPNNSCCSSGCNFVMNVLWAVTAGWILALQAFLTGVVLCLTIVGIPFGIQSFKLMQVCFCPFGKDFSSIQEEQQFTTTRRTTVQTTADNNPTSTARRSPPPSYQDYHRIQ